MEFIIKGLITGVTTKLGQELTTAIIDKLKHRPNKKD